MPNKRNPVKFDEKGAYLLCGNRKVRINYLDKEGKQIKQKAEVKHGNT